MAHTSVMWNSTLLKKMMVVGSHLSCSQMICSRHNDQWQQQQHSVCWLDATSTCQTRCSYSSI
jgi:hypothetical protein